MRAICSPTTIISLAKVMQVWHIDMYPMSLSESRKWTFRLVPRVINGKARKRWLHLNSLTQQIQRPTIGARNRISRRELPTCNQHREIEVVYDHQKIVVIQITGVDAE